MRRERAAFLISLNAIDSHLPSTRRPPTARRQGSCSKGTKSVSVGECACSLQKLFLNMTEFILNLLYLFIKNTNIPDRSSALVQFSSTMAALDVRTVYFYTTRLPQALLPASVCQTQK